MVNVGVHHYLLPVAHQRQKTVALTTISPSPSPCGATTRRARRGHAMPVPHGALPQRTRAIRANPRPMQIPGHSLDHSGEGSAL